jgi:hypothetical protein
MVPYFFSKAYEDILRHRSDAKLNKALVRVLRNGRFQMIQRREINVKTYL